MCLLLSVVGKKRERAWRVFFFCVVEVFDFRRAFDSSQRCAQGTSFVLMICFISFSVVGAWALSAWLLLVLPLSQFSRLVSLSVSGSQCIAPTRRDFVFFVDVVRLSRMLYTFYVPLPPPPDFAATWGQTMFLFSSGGVGDAHVRRARRHRSAAGLVRAGAGVGRHARRRAQAEGKEQAQA